MYTFLNLQFVTIQMNSVNRDLYKENYLINSSQKFSVNFGVTSDTRENVLLKYLLSLTYEIRVNNELIIRLFKLFNKQSLDQSCITLNIYHQFLQHSFKCTQREYQNEMLVRKVCLFRRSSHKLNTLSGYNLTYSGGKILLGLNK